MYLVKQCEAEMTEKNSFKFVAIIRTKNGSVINVPFGSENEYQNYLETRKYSWAALFDESTGELIVRNYA